MTLGPFLLGEVAFGSKTEVARHKLHFRFTLRSRHRRDRSPSPKAVLPTLEGVPTGRPAGGRHAIGEREAWMILLVDPPTGGREHARPGAPNILGRLLLSTVFFRARSQDARWAARPLGVSCSKAWDRIRTRVLLGARSCPGATAPA